MRDSSSSICLLIADVDGTLVTPEKVLTPRASSTVHSVLDSGIAFTITSGRPPRGTHPNANKGIVVCMLAEILESQHTASRRLATCPTDVLMFERSGMSIAMGQSSDEVKRAAQYVTASNRGEGFALAMERFVLANAHKQTSDQNVSTGSIAEGKP